MADGEPHSHALDPASDVAAEHWSERIPQLHEEIASLTRLLSSLHTDEKEAHEQIQSLTYATDLTRGEVRRRARANTELTSAYDAAAAAPAPPGYASPHRRVPLLEAHLLNAKRDAANLTFDVAQLEFRLKALRDRAAGVQLPTSAAMTAASPVLPALPSPQLASLSSRNSASLKLSPLLRATRLIADVDALVTIGNGPSSEPASLESYAPCRLGIATNSQMALHSYASPMPLLSLDDRTAKMEELSEHDIGALAENLKSLDIQIGGERYELCGLAEAVAASVQLIEDASQLLKTDDEEIATHA